MVYKNIPISVSDANELEIYKKAIEDKKNMLLLNLEAKEQQLHTGRSFHPKITQNTVLELRHEIQKIDDEYEDISRLQKEYGHGLLKKKWGKRWSHIFACTCFRHSHHSPKHKTGCAFELI